jgi:hypothetical protein
MNRASVGVAIALAVAGPAKTVRLQSNFDAAQAAYINTGGRAASSQAEPDIV